MSEKCQRCGAVGADRRTLWMACFYDMSELGLPFINTTREVDNKQRFYTLRVCKGCRSEWMDAIANWFRNPRASNIDENGNVSVSIEEYNDLPRH